ncbi:hypothetical protein M422DRAFT_248680 [Sphaerobolus stellatus SS14]|nr:hypothetical protein M422DRAFT_248680 [Sphaerobolus stellatus SS14]
MVLASLKLPIWHILTPQIYPTNPRKLTFENDEWESWLGFESAVYTNWRFKKEIPQAKSNRKRVYEWKRLYECDHAGSPRNRQDDNVSPKKRRKTGDSIKVGCSAKIEVYQLVGSDVVTVDHYWQHNDHSPATLKNIKMSRNPDAVRCWLDVRVHEGFDSKSIKAMIQMTSEELAEKMSTHRLQRLACKHMFIIQRVTTFNIQIERSIIPPAPLPGPEITNAVEARQQEKLLLLDKATALMDALADRFHFKRLQSSKEELDKVSTASITQYISAAQGLLHLKNDVFLHKSDYATQTH